MPRHYAPRPDPSRRQDNHKNTRLSGWRGATFVDALPPAPVDNEIHRDRPHVSSPRGETVAPGCLSVDHRGDHQSETQHEQLVYALRRHTPVGSLQFETLMPPHLTIRDRVTLARQCSLVVFMHAAVSQSRRRSPSPSLRIPEQRLARHHHDLSVQNIIRISRAAADTT
jgi:hypothetical protein